MGKLRVSYFIGSLKKCKRIHIVPSLSVYVDRDPVLLETNKFIINIEFCVFVLYGHLSIVRKR